MMPAMGDPEVALKVLRLNRATIAAITDGLTKEREATHQIGDADRKLLELEISGTGTVVDHPAGRRKSELLRQKQDGVHRLAAAKILRLTAQIEQHNRQLSSIDEVIRQAESPLVGVGGIRQ